MSPAEAVAITEEPNWIALWATLKVADDGYEVLLMKWRRWHHVVVDEQKRLAPSIDGMIALAEMGIMPVHTHRPPGMFAEQIDAHCWLVSQGRAWRIRGIEDKTLMLDSFGEQWQIDLSRAKWEKYCEAAAAVLEAAQ
jgi:hypothetical protein